MREDKAWKWDVKHRKVLRRKRDSQVLLWFQSQASLWTKTEPKWTKLNHFMRKSSVSSVSGVFLGNSETQKCKFLKSQIWNQSNCSQSASSWEKAIMRSKVASVCLSWVCLHSWSLMIGCQITNENTLCCCCLQRNRKKLNYFYSDYRENFSVTCMFWWSWVN